MSRFSHRSRLSVPRPRARMRRLSEAFGRDYLDCDTFEEAWEEAVWDELEDIKGGLNARLEKHSMQFLNPNVTNWGDPSESYSTEGSIEVWLTGNMHYLAQNEPAVAEEEVAHDVDVSFGVWGNGFVDSVAYEHSDSDGSRMIVYFTFNPDINQDEWYEGKMEQDSEAFESCRRVSRGPSARRTLPRRSGRRMRRF